MKKTEIKKVAILANGGDVSGFNAVIRGIVKTAENHGIKCYGIIEGYNGLLQNNYIELNSFSNASGILSKGGSIIGSSTNANVFHYKSRREGEDEYIDLSDVCIEKMELKNLQGIFIKRD